MADGPKKASVWRYIKEAFTFRWNLLFFGGAMAAAVLSPAPDIVIPLVAAGEVAYLAMLATLPRFQQAIDAKARSETRGGSSNPEEQRSAQQKLLDVLGGLEPGRRARFLKLRARCLEMQRIAHGVRGETHDASGATAELRTPALDRLLWVFLKLLLSEQAVQRFLGATDLTALSQQVTQLEERRKKAEAKGDERILRSVTDAIATAEQRVANFERARSNLDFISLELDRIEQKIHALMESAVSHTDPDQLSVQVDAVADGIQQTEATIRELQSITGVMSDDDVTPVILGDIAEVAKS